MGDMGDDFNAWKRAKMEKRAKNRDASPQRLTEAGVKFDSRNLGAHLIVQSQAGTIDFWPGTGNWIIRSTQQKGRGVFDLIKFIKK